MALVLRENSAKTIEKIVSPSKSNFTRVQNLTNLKALRRRNCLLFPLEWMSFIAVWIREYNWMRQLNVIFRRKGIEEKKKRLIGFSSSYSWGCVCLSEKERERKSQIDGIKDLRNRQTHRLRHWQKQSDWLAVTNRVQYREREKAPSPNAKKETEREKERLTHFLKYRDVFFLSPFVACISF